jgi:hypothetical protein
MRWVVYRYEQVDATSFGDRAPLYMAGEVDTAQIVLAGDEDDAILTAANGSQGFFTAHPFIEQRPRRVVAKLVDDSGEFRNNT